jgi:hypothetical protein
MSRAHPLVYETIPAVRCYCHPPHSPHRIEPDLLPSAQGHSSGEVCALANRDIGILASKVKQLICLAGRTHRTAEKTDSRSMSEVETSEKRLTFPLAFSALCASVCAHQPLRRGLRESGHHSVRDVNDQTLTYGARSTLGHDLAKELLLYEVDDLTASLGSATDPIIQHTFVICLPASSWTSRMVWTTMAKSFPSMLHTTTRATSTTSWTEAERSADVEGESSA